MKISSISLLAAIAAGNVFSVNADTNVGFVVCAKIGTFCDSIYPDYLRRPEVVADVGIRKCDLDSDTHRDLSNYVSNNIDSVFAEFNSCATNQLQKYILLSTGWTCGNEYYLDFLNRIVSLANNGGISIEYVDWYMMARKDDEKWRIILRDYERPVVSNIIDKLQLLTGRTNYYNRVRSGEAYRSYLEITESVRME